MMSDLICVGVQVGCACQTRAAMPAVWGDAIDVPDSRIAPVPVPTLADGIETPGAATSGFWALSPLRGPSELKSATCWYPGLTIVVPPVRVMTWLFAERS